ncbi:MAG: hypothetical protein GXP46_03095, partial [Deferribacteres bacterium]|nr:hypothetical protein [Deferribacteres bacterium]
MLEFSLKKFHFVNYLLGVLILISVLLLIRSIVSVSFSKKELPVIEKKSSRAAAPGKKDIMYYATILEKNPFGRPMKLRPIAVSTDTKKPYGPLKDLVLVGTAVGPGNRSYAVFEDKSSSGKQEVFAYGEQVFNYGIITRIGWSSVELQRDSAVYTLTIPFENLNSAPPVRRRQPRKSRRTKASFARKVGEREYILDSTKVQQSLENPEKILTDARLLPNFKDGRQEGFSISEVVPGGLYHSLGLRNGDILLRINGLKISNPEVAIQAMSALKGMNKINLD